MERTPSPPTPPPPAGRPARQQPVQQVDQGDRRLRGFVAHHDAPGTSANEYGGHGPVSSSWTPVCRRASVPTAAANSSMRPSSTRYEPLRTIRWGFPDSRAPAAGGGRARGPRRAGRAPPGGPWEPGEGVVDAPGRGGRRPPRVFPGGEVGPAAAQ